jgi:hypothetical protein
MHVRGGTQGAPFGIGPRHPDMSRYIKAHCVRGTVLRISPGSGEKNSETTVLYANALAHIGPQRTYAAGLAALSTRLYIELGASRRRSR